MTVVNPKSISGINSITMASGSDNLLTIHTTNTTERVRVNSDGDVIVGSGITVSPDGDIFTTGVTTSTTFVGALTGNVTGNISGGTVAGSTGTFTGAVALSDNISVSGDVDIADKIIHIGDTDTALRFPAADTITAETGGAEAIRINNSGQFLVGVTAARTMLSGYTPSLQVEGTANSDSSLSIVENISAASGPSIWFGKTRGGSLGDNTIVQDGDELGTIVFNGADGTDVQSMGAFIRASVDGTPGSNDMPGRITIHTTADGASSPTERLRIDSSGRVLIGGTSNPSGESIRTLNLIATSASESALVFSRSNSLGGSTTGQTIRLQTNGDLNFTVHNVGEKVRFPAAGGITFNGDTAAANALDDYEEGTFTPAIVAGRTGSISYSNQVGFYTKVGNRVFAQVYLRISGGTNNGATFTIGGFPFGNINTTSYEGGGYHTYQGNFFTSDDNKNNHPWLSINSSQAIFHKVSNGSVIVGNDTNTSENYLIFHLQYIVT